MKVDITVEAERDLAEAAEFYEMQDAGVGEYFMRTLVAEIDALEHTGGIHRRKWGFHRALSATFPFVVFYLVIDGMISVRAVFDCRRDPKSLRQRIADRRIGE